MSREVKFIHMQNGQQYQLITPLPKLEDILDVTQKNRNNNFLILKTNFGEVAINLNAVSELILQKENGER